MSNPMLRNLQYQIQHGVQDIKLETNQGEHKMKNIVVPEGANQEEYLQKMMAEDHKNKEREKKAKEAREEKARKVRARAAAARAAAARPHASLATHAGPCLCAVHGGWSLSRTLDTAGAHGEVGPALLHRGRRGIARGQRHVHP